MSRREKNKAKRLQKLVRIRARMRDRAAADHSGEQRACTAAEQSRDEAVSQLQLDTGSLISAEELSRLGEVLDWAERRLVAANVSVAKSRAQLAQRGVELHRSERLLERSRVEIKQQELRGEQKQLDEIASRTGRLGEVA